MNTAQKLQSGHYDSVLFDLDGTLLDTAPDMVTALQELQSALDYQPIEYQLGRSNVSNGAVGLLRVGFPDMDESERMGLMCDFIDRYVRILHDQTTVFPGVDDLLQKLDDGARLWGVVTNKPAHLTDPLMKGLDLYDRCAAVISGDTLATRKPDPAPLLHACDVGQIDPQRCIYVGDANRDIEAGRRAGMATVAATYGYITDDDDPLQWGADRIARDPAELTQIVLKAVNLGF
jgi:phosphoglycolate phosphatase